MKHLLAAVAVCLFVVVSFAEEPLARLQTAMPDKPVLKPYFDILKTPGGVNILRDAPADHLHHHGLMFAIKVDGINFWEEHGDAPGKEVVESTTEIFGDNAIKCKQNLVWVGKDKELKELAVEKRNVNIATGIIPEATLVDWTSTFTLPEGKEKAVLGGNSYHGLGMRFVESMDKDGKFFCDDPEKTAEALRGTERLTECNWMAYTAKADGKPVTVAIFDTPGNPRKMLAFTMGDGKKVFAYLSATCNLFHEPITLTPTKPITFRYAIALWDGEQSRETVDKAFRIWEKGVSE